MASEAQRRANRKYRAKHKKQQNLYSKRSTARSFIRKYANFNDLTEFQKLIEERKKYLLNKNSE